MKIKRIISIILIFILAIFLVACSGDKSGNLDNNTGQKFDENQDGELTNELLEEKEVSAGQIYLRDKWVIGAIVIKDGVSEDRAKEIAQEYAEKLRDKYKDKKVNVQVVQDGNNIANIEL